MKNLKRGQPNENQVYNKGDLKELKVMDRKRTVESFEENAKHTNTPIEDLVVMLLSATEALTAITIQLLLTIKNKFIN